MLRAATALAASYQTLTGPVSKFMIRFLKIKQGQEDKREILLNT